MTVLDTGRESEKVFAVAFYPDGKHLLGGGDDGIQRWRLSDNQEVGKQTGTKLRAICVSKDQKWVVCGAFEGASVWDAQIQEKVIDVEGINGVRAVDISPESTRFATGTERGEVSIWGISSGERLVGPLQLDKHTYVAGIKFSPNGEHIAAACYGCSIRIFDSHNGDELIDINIEIPRVTPATPLAWSGDGQRIFAASNDKKVRSFEVSTGSQLAELQLINSSHVVRSIALSANGKFIAIIVDRSISFLDTSTLSRIGPIIEDNTEMRSIAISQDSSYLATGRDGGKIDIRPLSKILSDSYGPFDVCLCAFILSASPTHLL